MEGILLYTNWLSAITVLYLVIYIFKITYEMKYKFHEVFINKYLYHNDAPAEWLSHNRYYYWCLPLIVSGIIIALDYGNKLNGDGAIFIRTDLVQIIAPLFYLSMAMLLAGKHERVKRLNLL